MPILGCFLPDCIPQAAAAGLKEVPKHAVAVGKVHALCVCVPGLL